MIPRKITLLILIATFCSIRTSAQTQQQQPLITVIGSAEVKAPPDFAPGLITVKASITVSFELK
jgi:uncharacterized protein YggE